MGDGVKERILVAIFLFLGGCASQTSDLIEVAKDNQIEASRFKEYGYVPMASTKYRHHDNSVMYTKDKVCVFVNEGGVKKLDLVKIYNESSYVAVREKGYFGEESVRAYEYFGYKAANRSEDARKKFLRMIEGKGSEIYADLTHEVMKIMDANSGKLGAIILFEAHNVPARFDGCEGIVDITDQVLKILNSQ